MVNASKCCAHGSFLQHVLTTSLIIFFIAIQGPSICAQDKSSSRIERLRGGTIGMNMKWSGEAFSSGLGSRADAMGGSISTLFPDAESIASNPAGLGFARGFYVILDWSPPVRIDPAIAAKPFGIGNLEDRVNDSLRNSARDNSPNGVLEPGIVEDATVNSELDMRGGLKGAAVLYGHPLFSLAASFYQPFRFETQLSMSGMEFLAASLNDSGDETQRIFGTVNGNLNVNLNIENSSVAIATRLFPKLAVGMAFDNLNGELNFEGTFLPEGIIRSAGGDSRAFNDPARVQYDSLFANIRGDWEGSARRVRWGVGYHPNRHISLDATVVMPFSMNLTGPFSMIHNNIRALNLDAGEDEEVFDVDILVEDNLTRTDKRVTQTPGMELESPGLITAGFSAKWQNYVASAVLTRYFDNLGYRFNYEQFDSLGVRTTSGKVHQGIKLGSAFRFGIGVKQLILGGGVLFGESFKTTLKNNEVPEISKPGDILLPFFSLGGGFKMSSHFRFDYVVSLYSSSFFRFSTSYHLKPKQKWRSRKARRRK